jgi:hypothetical protein
LAFGYGMPRLTAFASLAEIFFCAVMRMGRAI